MGCSSIPQVVSSLTLQASWEKAGEPTGLVDVNSLSPHQLHPASNSAPGWKNPPT